MVSMAPAFTLDAAQDLLAAFDVADDPHSRAFLADLLASGAAPEKEVDELMTKLNKRRTEKAQATLSHEPSEAVNDTDGSSGWTLDSLRQDGSPWLRRREIQTLAVFTRRTVVGASPELELADPAPAPPPAPPPAQKPSTASPAKRSIRETTSYFFSPSKKKTANNDSDSSDDTDDTDNTSDDDTDKATPSTSRRGLVSALPFPPLDSPSFGLVQERLADEPFWLLVALVFLTRVAGRVSLPVFWAIKADYPTPQSLAAADCARLIARMRHLGMASVRCTALQRYARRWIERPPQAGVVTTVKHYPPLQDDGGGGDAMAACHTDSQWEIGHITQGAYALDSWRIFCRDRLLGRSTDWKGDVGPGLDSADQNNNKQAFQPEWMRVLPQDKELRACLRWMWMREGWDWDPKTGDRTVLRDELWRAVNEGRVGYNTKGELQIVRG